MVDVAKEGPSAHALRQLNNRNNLADLKLKKTLEQFDRERTFIIAHLARDKLDTKDFLRNVKYCDSDYLPQSRAFLGSPSQRRRRSQTARTAPGRITREPNPDTDLSDDDSDSDVIGAERDAMSMPGMRGTRLLATRDTLKPRVLNEYQRAENFLRRLREQVVVEELQSHYTDSDYNDFVAAVVTKFHRNVTPSINTPSITIPNGPTTYRFANGGVGRTSSAFHRKDDNVARFDMVYPIRLLGNVETKNEPRTPTPSPSLGSGSLGIRGTPVGLPEGGALGQGARLVMTAPQPVKPSTAMSLNGLPTNPRSETSLAAMRAMLKSRFKTKPLDERVKEFCRELDDIRLRRSQILPQSMKDT